MQTTSNQYYCPKLNKMERVFLDSILLSLIIIAQIDHK